MSEELEVDLSEFEIQFRRFMEHSRRGVEAEFKTQCKGLIKRVIDITPPASQSGTGISAKRMGQSAIRRDLIGYGGFSRHQKRAGIFTVLSDSLIDAAIDSGAYEGGENVRLWIRKDGSVYGTQRHFFWPDASMSEMRDHHKRFFKNGEMSAAGGYTREIARWKWIDQMVVRASTYNRYLKSQERKVGMYAAGWRPGAQALGVGTPQYMKNHGAIGAVEFRVNEENLDFSMINAVGYGSVDRQMVKRIQAAAQYQINAMERQIENIVRKYGAQVT